MHPLELQLLRDSRHGQQAEVFICCLVHANLLVTNADDILAACPFQEIGSKDRRAEAYLDVSGKNAVRRLHLSITMVNRNQNRRVTKFFHTAFSLSLQYCR